MNRLEDKAVIVTGAAGGIGEAIARLFAEEGAKVLATDVQYNKLGAWVNEAKNAGAHIEFAALDVTTPRQLERSDNQSDPPVW